MLTVTIPTPASNNTVTSTAYRWDRSGIGNQCLDDEWQVGFTNKTNCGQPMHDAPTNASRFPPRKCTFVCGLHAKPNDGHNLAYYSLGSKLPVLVVYSIVPSEYFSEQLNAL